MMPDCGRRMEFLASAALVAGLVAGCADPDTVTEATTWTVDPAPQLSIGEVEGDEGYLLGWVIDAKIQNDGSIVVADRQSRLIRVYDSLGVHLRTFGGAGDGPGEFNGLGALWTDGSRIGGFDTRIARFTLFSANGQVLSTTSIPQTEGRFNAWAGRYPNDDHVVGRLTNTLTPPPRPDSMEFARFGEVGNATVVGTGLGFQREEVGLHPLSPNWMAGLRADSLWVTDGTARGINIYAPDGSLARTLSFPVPQQTEVEMRALLTAELEARGDQEEAAELAAAPPLAEVPVVSRIMIDDTGHWWLRHFDPAISASALNGFFWWQGGTWTVMDAAGTAVATIDMPDHFMPLSVQGDRIVGFWRDDLRVERVEVYGFSRD